MEPSLIEGFVGFLKVKEPSLINFVVDVGEKFEGSFSLKSELDTLRIEVGASEIVLVYGYFHDHFLAPDEPEEEAFAEIIDLGRSIMSESVVAFYVHDQHEKLISSILDAPNFQPKIPPGGKVRMRSFKGTYNKGLSAVR